MALFSGTTVRQGIVDPILDGTPFGGPIISCEQYLTFTATFNQNRTEILGVGNDSGRALNKRTIIGQETAVFTFEDGAPTYAFLQAYRGSLAKPLTGSLPKGELGVTTEDDATDSTFELPETPETNSVKVYNKLTGGEATEAVPKGFGATSVDVTGTTVTLTGAGISNFPYVVTYTIAASSEEGIIFGNADPAFQIGLVRITGKFIDNVESGIVQTPFFCNKARISIDSNSESYNGNENASYVITLTAEADANGNLFVEY